MAIAVKKSAKIKPYKFVDTRVSISKDATDDQKSLIIGLQKQQQAINNIGNTLNSIAAVLQDFRDNQAKQIKLQEASVPKFEARYTTNEKSGKREGGGGIATPSMSLPKVGFLESLMGFLKNTVGTAISVAALNWLSDENNREKVRNTIDLIVNVMKAVVNFVSRETKDFIDDMYTLLSDESTPAEKLGVVLERVGKFALAFMAIRYLKNPLKIVSDLGSVLGFFNKNLLNSRNVLIRRASKIAALAAGALLLAKAFEQKDQIKEKAETIATGTKNFLETNEQAQQVREVVTASKDVAVEGVKQATEAVKNRSSGGGLGPARAMGGWIQGPQTGYPVSLDGGRSTAFIGHGTEYVAQKANGGFVIPVDTPATRGNSNLTDLRISQASAAGYNLGGMFDSMASGGRRRKRGEKEGEEVSKGFRYGKLMASGGGISLTSNGGRPLVNKRLLEGQQYKFSDLMPHSHNVTTATVYDGIGMGPGKDYGVGKLPQYMPSGPNGLIPTPQAGEVLRAGDINNGYGKSVLVKGPLGVMGFHHLSKIASGVRQGSRVSAGKIVGTQGATGGNYAEHLHLNATPKGHEAFVNYVTTGKPTTGSSTGGDNQPRQSTSALQLSGPSKQRVDAMGGDRFLTPFIAMCKRLKADPAAMLGKMASESGILPNKPASSGAVGLIQFIPSTWNGLGTGKPHSWLRTASGIEQLPYIEKFLKPTFAKAPKDSRGMVSDGHVYVSTFLPAFVEGDANTVIMTSSGVLPEESKKLHSPSVGTVREWWADNNGLDGYNPATGKADPAMRDGKVTIGELAGRIAAKKTEYGISGGVTSGSAIDYDSSGNAITPSSSASASMPALTMETLSSGLAGGLAAFAKALGADIDVEAFKARFEGVAPGELPDAPAASSSDSGSPSSSIAGFKLPADAGFNVSTSSVPSSPRSTFQSAFTGKSLLPEGTDIDLEKLFTNDKLNLGFGDGSGTDMNHFRPGGGNDAGDGVTKIKPSSITSTSKSAPPSSGGGGGGGAISAPPASTPTGQRSMVQQTKVNIDTRPQREGASGETLQRMAATVQKANARVEALQRQSAQSINDANTASRPTHNVRTQKSGNSISLVDQLNSVNNILAT